MLLIEGGLRLAGVAISSIQESANRRKLKDKDIVKIMCVGESTTAIGGEFSYPSQLEKILNENFKDERFRVINKGVPMTNTSVIAEDIEGWIKEYQPDVVVLMMGINDHNKLIPVDMDAAGNFISSTRLYKLYQWIIKGFFYQRRSRSADEDRRFDRENAIKMVREKKIILHLVRSAYQTDNRVQIYFIKERIRKLSEWVPDNEDVYIALGDALLEKGWYEELPEVINYFLDRNQHHSWLYEKIAMGCRDINLKNVVMRHLAAEAEKAPQNWRIREFIGICHALSDDHESAQRYFSEVGKLRKKVVDNRTRENYLRILRSFNKYNIPFVLVQYPTRDLEEIKIMVQDEWDVNKLYFVDNEQVFKDAVIAEGYDTYFIDRFAGNFGHCTPKGNHLLASNIARQIQIYFNF